MCVFDIDKSYKPGASVNFSAMEVTEHLVHIDSVLVFLPIFVCSERTWALNVTPCKNGTRQICRARFRAIRLREEFERALFLRFK